MNVAKKCLVVSYGPVPTPENQTVEGGGMRAWGIAKGLKHYGVEVTVSINSSFPQSLHEHQGIKLANWSLDSEFIRTINSFDSVIVSYCAGDLSVFIADNINDGVQLILDAYVPIYIEVSARDAKDMSTEYANYMADLQRHNHTLRRGDYFLYANPAQEQLYSGVLSALGIINPHSYREKRLIYAPFGIHRDAVLTSNNPYITMNIKKTDFVVLWFGGIYPWFRIEEYLNAIESLSKDKSFKFVFVGGKNPFNDNADIARQYNKALAFAQDSKLIDKSIFFVDWVDFDTRINWFMNADIIVSLNQPGEENKYSWRTRVMDFVWGETATITNGGDPLSDEMVASNAAVMIDSLSAESIIKTLHQLRSNPSELVSIRDNVKKLKDKYYWDVVMQPVAAIIEKGTHPYGDEGKLRSTIKLNQPVLDTIPIPSSKLLGLFKMPLKVARKIRQKGIRRTARVVRDIASTQIKRHLNRELCRERQFIFISHPIDNTGAPVVLLQIITEYVEKYGASRVRVVAPGALKNQEDYLKKLGIKVEKAVFGASFRFIRLQLNLRQNDFVLMNTVAIYDNYRDFVLLWLKLGRLDNAYWFIHEDKAQIPIINAQFTDIGNMNQIKYLVSKAKLHLLYPSKRTLEEYQNLLGIEGGSNVKLRVDIPEKYKGARKEQDFEEINILLSGTSSDGRKGQVIALSALQYFIDNYYNKNTDGYRKINLNLVAVGDKDYLSQQIRWIAQSALSDYVTVYNSMPKDEAMDIASACNTVLCCSLNETFGLYIAEGMLMGHIVLRNDSAGIDEQLVDGENGFKIDHTDIKTIARAFEKLTNKHTSSRQLKKMSEKSLLIMNGYADGSYIEQIESYED